MACFSSPLISLYCIEYTIFLVVVLLSLSFRNDINFATLIHINVEGETCFYHENVWSIDIACIATQSRTMDCNWKCNKTMPMDEMLHFFEHVLMIYGAHFMLSCRRSNSAIKFAIIQNKLVSALSPSFSLHSLIIRRVRLQ